jgi:hypothetical protein
MSLARACVGVALYLESRAVSNLNLSLVGASKRTQHNLNLCSTYASCVAEHTSEGCRNSWQLSPVRSPFSLLFAMGRQRLHVASHAKDTRHYYRLAGFIHTYGYGYVACVSKPARCCARQLLALCVDHWAKRRAETPWIATARVRRGVEVEHTCL